MAKSVLERAADFIVESDYDSIDPAVIELSRRAVLDVIGCGLAGCCEQVVLNTWRWAGKRSWGQSSAVLGRDLAFDSEHAAMCNAVAGHALDFDDTSWTTIGHPSVVAVPAALALCEELDLSGADLLKAYAVGVEVGHKISRSVMPATSRQGWHTTSVFGVLIAAATSACLLSLDRETVVNALALSLSRASGLRSNFGTMTKPLHAGLAVKAGMEAVGLAAQGVTASPQAFEGSDGFSSCFAQTDAVVKVEFGQKWDLAENGLAFKLYPCCSGAHPAVDVMLDLVDKAVLNVGDIDHIRVGTSLLAPRELVNHSPRTPMEAKFSMEFALAAALLRKRLTLDEFSPDFIQSGEVQGLMPRIGMDVDEELARLGFVGTSPVKIKITLNNGSTIAVRNDLARGNPDKPLNDGDFSKKFMGNAVRTISKKKAEIMLDRLFALSAETDIGELMSLTR